MLTMSIISNLQHFDPTIEYDHVPTSSPFITRRVPRPNIKEPNLIPTPTDTVRINVIQTVTLKYFTDIVLHEKVRLHFPFDIVRDILLVQCNKNQPKIKFIECCF